MIYAWFGPLTLLTVAWCRSVFFGATCLPDISALVPVCPYS